MEGLTLIGASFLAACAILTALLKYLSKVYKIGPFISDSMASTDNNPEVAILYPPKPTTVPVEAPSIPIVKKDYITIVATAIQQFEGWNPGSNAYKHNNPGNCKDLDGNFLTFKTYQAGFDYLKDYLTRAATGKHPAYKPTDTIDRFFHRYTSDPEPSPTNYAIFVCKYLGDGFIPSSPISKWIS